MNCAEAEPLIGASLDGELDPLTALLIDNHVSGCGFCTAQLSCIERLHREITEAQLDWSSETDLYRLGASIRRRARPARRRRPWLVGSGLATAIAAALLALAVIPPKGQDAEREVVDSHVRSLMAGHLLDVPSSDHHTVKPWFQGRLNFSPAVPDLSAQGFKLAGGRVDVIHGELAAVIVYQRRLHIINLSITPGAGPDEPLRASALGGFHILRWQSDGMLYWAVSDLNEAELRVFADLTRGR
jgi:anti-sigma factor RsiW